MPPLSPTRCDPARWEYTRHGVLELRGVPSTARSQAPPSDTPAPWHCYYWVCDVRHSNEAQPPNYQVVLGNCFKFAYLAFTDEGLVFVNCCRRRDHVYTKKWALKFRFRTSLKRLGRMQPYGPTKQFVPAARLCLYVEKVHSRLFAAKRRTSLHRRVQTIIPILTCSY